jgi:hypothetical protein
MPSKSDPHPSTSLNYLPVVVGAAPYRIVTEVLLILLLRSKVLQWVGPQQVTHGAERRRLLEPVQLRGRRLGER